ncbi:MAG: hypothetical protein WBB89_08245 [Candidatus Acidiferrum sp.]
MERKHTRTSGLKTIAVTALGGLGTYFLFENLGCAVGQLREVFCGVAGLGLLPSIVLGAWQIMQANGFEHRLLERFFQMLLSLWPLLLAVVGAS